MAAPLIVWRHPRPQGANGRCIGRTDLSLDRRKAKRLAHRIRERVRRERWAKVVVTSPLRRSAEVGRWLARWGFKHRIDARLSELDFGQWEGRCWTGIAAAELSAWTDDFVDHAPGGGESVGQLLTRCRSFFDDLGNDPLCVVGHAGWINAARWLAGGGTRTLRADQWPMAVRYAEAVTFFSSSGGAESQ